MKTLADLQVAQKQREKRNKTMLIILISIVSIITIYLFTIDPWDIAYKNEKKAIDERYDEFSQIYKNYLDEGKFIEAFYVQYNLDLDDLKPDYYSLLSDSERIIEFIQNVNEGRYEDNYYDLDYLLNNFYREYSYQKKYGAPSNYLEDIKDQIEEYVSAYNLVDADELNRIKGANSYE